MSWITAAANIIGGLYAKKQADKAVGTATDQATWAYGESQPRRYTGMFGGYDPETGEFLSQDWQARMQQFMDRSSATGQQIQDLGPLELQQEIYGQQLGLLQPQQERQFLSTEARLAQQGRLGATGGAGQLQALEEAQAQERAGLLAGSYATAQQTQDAMRRREYEDLMQAMNIGQIPTQYGNISMAEAQLRGQNAWNKAQMISGAATNRAGANVLMASNLASNLGSQDFSNFRNPFSGMFSSTYNPTPYTPGATMGNIHSPGKY